MIRYRYVAGLTPPASFVNLHLRCPATGREARELPAQIDTAADRTIIPGPVGAALELAQDGLAVFQAFGGQLIELPIYLVEVAVHDLPPAMVRVAFGEREPCILLGRGVLNSLRLVLDGPQLVLDIG